ncbi:SH3 domain-containing protein [Intestinibacter bartlettii]|uniref:SH3 domain-containing protein n=1 Tax=Intestinibacter bartlettii TaxID=261299 RepID=UPI002904EBE7|nr:SH3 domain-containing protein [Intestinibacter bartlettii]MDU2164193.1 SH3 domain-containing protein [Intestinibacter bartlettii]
MPKQFKKAACFLTVLGLLTSFVFGAHSSYAMPKQKDAKQATKVLSNSELKTLDLEGVENVDNLDDLLLDIDWGFDYETCEELEQDGILYVINDNDEVVITDCSDSIDKSTISIPDKIDGHPVTMIYYYVFSGLENTKTINIPDSVKVIGAEAFAWSNNLQTINIPTSVTTIDAAAFAGNNKLQSITIPDSVTELGVGAFILCENLTNVTLPNTISSIPYGTFAACVSLKKINIPSSVKTIEDEAFSMTGFTEFTVPDTITSIGARAFSDCENLVKVTIPKTVTKIGDDIFEGGSEDVTIYGEKGSYAEKYANKNDISFKAISSGQEDPSDILTGKTTAKLNVRKGPGTKYAKMGTLSKGAKVEVITKLPSGWYKIKYKGTYGYVLGKYVKLNTPQQDEKVIATGKTTAQLNVRKGSSTKYAKIGSLSKGAKVEIVSKLSNGWYKIKYNGTYGYVSGAYVKLDSEQPKPGEDEKIIATGKTTVSSLNVRSGPSSNYSKLGILTKGTKVEVVERYSNGWYKIKYKGSYGYVSGAYVSLDGSKGEVIATGKTTAGLNVRSGAGTGYKKIGHLNKGTKVEIVTKLSNGWYKIKFNSSYGYVSGDYVKLI